MVELTARVALESMMAATADDATPIIRRLARIQTRAVLDQMKATPDAAASTSTAIAAGAGRAWELFGMLQEAEAEIARLRAAPKVASDTGAGLRSVIADAVEFVEAADSDGFDPADALDLIREVAALATPTDATDEDRGVPCERCQGNGEIVTDWGRYVHGQPGDTGDEGTADCPDCDGTGRVTDATDGATGGGDFVAGPIWAEDEDDCFTAEVQVVGGHEVVATVHGATHGEAEQRQAAVMRALATTPGGDLLEQAPPTPTRMRRDEQR